MDYCIALTAGCCSFCGNIFCAACTPNNMTHPRTNTGERACQACTTKYSADGCQVEQRQGLAEQGAALVGLQQQDQSPAAMSSRFGVRWREDSERIGCAACAIDFDSLVRKHHCRHCGDLFCQGCSAEQLLHPLTGTAERACQGCVSAQRVRQATALELQSSRFIARAATALVSILAVGIGVVSGSGRAVVFGAIGESVS